MERFAEQLQLPLARTPWDRRRALRGVLDAAYRANAQTVIVERRYVDIDYRDEYARHYGKTFRAYPPVTTRLHFFADEPPADIHRPDVAVSFVGLQYLGYQVVRPVHGAPVGRAVLAPDPRLRRYVTCTAIDRANLFGAANVVDGVPFMGQDAQLTSCGHAAAWMAAYYHHLRYGAARWLPGAVAAAAPPELGRSIPSTGLTTSQLAEVLNRLGLPALIYDERTTDPSQLSVVARRYLDSALPVIVGTEGHAFLLVGYRPDGKRRTEFVCQDDEHGPYVLRRFGARQSPRWKRLIVPLPEQMHVPAERAEPLGEERLRKQLAASDATPMATTVLSRLDGKSVGIITSAIPSNDFKATLDERGFDPIATSGYARLPMPKWLWVVEAVDLDAHRKYEPSVYAEAVLDPTDHSRDLRTLAWRVPGLLRHWDSESDSVGDLALATMAPTRSVAATAWRRPVRGAS